VASHAARLLARRPLTGGELREGLVAAGHTPDAVEAICARLEEAGQIDDEKLARHFILTRAARLGHGPGRLIGDLVRRGVRRDVAEHAWVVAVDEGEVSLEDILAQQVRRRIARRGRPLDRRAYARVYNALLRAGFPADAVERALSHDRPADDALAHGEP